MYGECPPTKGSKGEGDLGFRVSALGFKDGDARPPTKAGKSGEKLKKGPDFHTAGTNVWWVPTQQGLMYGGCPPRRRSKGEEDLGFRVSALGFKDGDGCPPTKPGKSERQRDRETEATTTTTTTTTTVSGYCDLLLLLLLLLLLPRGSILPLPPLIGSS